MGIGVLAACNLFKSSALGTAASLLDRIVNQPQLPYNSSKPTPSLLIIFIILIGILKRDRLNRRVFNVDVLIRIRIRLHVFLPSDDRHFGAFANS